MGLLFTITVGYSQINRQVVLVWIKSKSMKYKGMISDINIMDEEIKIKIFLACCEFHILKLIPKDKRVSQNKIQRPGKLHCSSTAVWMSDIGLFKATNWTYKDVKNGKDDPEHMMILFIICNLFQISLWCFSRYIGKSSILIFLREKILAWTRIRTRFSSSTRWRYNH